MDLTFETKRKIAPWLINIEPQNGWLEDDVLSIKWALGTMSIFRGVLLLQLSYHLSWLSHSTKKHQSCRQCHSRLWWSPGDAPLLWVVAFVGDGHAALWEEGNERPRWKLTEQDRTRSCRTGRSSLKGCLPAWIRNRITGNPVGISFLQYFLKYITRKRILKINH